MMDRMLPRRGKIGMVNSFAIVDAARPWARVAFEVHTINAASAGPQQSGCSPARARHGRESHLEHAMPIREVLASQRVKGWAGPRRAGGNRVRRDKSQGQSATDH